MKHLGKGGFHPRALSRGQKNDTDFLHSRVRKSTRVNYSGSQSAINGKRFRIALWRRLIWNLREPLFTSPQNKHQKSDRGHEGSQGNDRSQEGIPTGAAP